MTAPTSYMQRLYLVKCYRQHKFLFFVSLIFIGAVLYGHKTSCEIFPAIVPGMYAGTTETSTSDFLYLVADSQDLDLHHTIDEPRRMMIFSTLAAYDQGALSLLDPTENAIRKLVQRHPFMKMLAANTVNTPGSYKQYLPWLRQYLRYAVNKDIHHLYVYQLHVHYDEHNLPVADYHKLLYELDSTRIK
jgi:hypothetical protein